MPYTEINLRWMKDIYLKAKTSKLLEETIEEYLHDHGIAKDFLG